MTASGSGRPEAPPVEVAAAPAFAHASEAELARILDYYQVEWRYEPRTFPILFNLDGAVVESFSPDFYLPEFDLYVELTTLKQSLVRKKNRKLRRLRELYPDVRIKLFYARDFKALLLKYGRFDLAASLSGEEGQARPAEAAPLVGATSAGASDSVDLTAPGAAAAAVLGALTEGAAATPEIETTGAVRHRRSRRARRRRRAAAGAVA